MLRLVHAVTGRVGLLEPDPHPDGTYRVLMLDERILAGTYTTAQDVDDGDRVALHRSHFATCLVARRRPRRPTLLEQADADATPPAAEPAEGDRCCHACGFTLHDDLFRSDMPAIYAELHPLCIPDERLAEVPGPTLLDLWRPAGQLVSA